MLAVSMQTRGSDTGYAECKPANVVQSAHQQALISSAYLPTSNYLYHSDDEDECHPVNNNQY